MRDRNEEEHGEHRDVPGVGRRARQSVLDLQLGVKELTVHGMLRGRVQHQPPHVVLSPEQFGVPERARARRLVVGFGAARGRAEAVLRHVDGQRLRPVPRARHELPLRGRDIRPRQPVRQQLAVGAQRRRHVRRHDVDGALLARQGALARPVLFVDPVPPGRRGRPFGLRRRPTTAVEGPWRILNG